MDKRDDKYLDKIFREKLYEHKMDVPDDLWNAIEANISDKSVALIPFWKKPWFAAASVILLVSASVSFMYWNLKEESEKINTHAMAQIETDTEEVNPLVGKLKAASPLHVMRDDLKEPVKSRQIAQQKFIGAEKAVLPAFADESESIESEDQSYMIAETDSEDTNNELSEDEKQAKIKAFAQLGTEVSKGSENEFNKAQKIVRKTGVSINFGNSGLSDQATKNADATLRRSAGKYNAQLMSMVRPVGYYEDSRVKHFTPLSLAVMFDKQILKNLFVEAGFSYTYMRSELQSFSNYRKETQNLHYIGIPLAFRYNVWKWKGLSAYVKAGGAIDFNIAGTWKESYSYNADYGRGSLNSFDEALEKRPQLSVSGAVGVGYNLSNLFQLYFEPGVAYYFDNDSYILNIRKDKPVDLSLQLGARFNF